MSLIDERAAFEKAKKVLERTSWTLSMCGSWPMAITKKSKIKFSLFMMYFGSHLLMEYADFITVFGDLQMMIINLMESGLQSVIMFKILVLRFNPRVRRVVIDIENEIEMEKTDDPEELKLFLQYNESAEYFHKIMMWFAVASVVAWYVLPLQNYIIATLQNQTAILIIPYRIYPFFDISPMDRTIIIYILEFPMMYTSACYAAIFGVMTTLVKNICAQLSILSHRIRNIKNNKTQKPFQYFVEKHVRIIQMTKNLDSAFNLVLCFELVVSTVLIGLVFYTTMVNFSDADAIALISFALYAIAMLLLVYANCLMGEELKFEMFQLREALYQCDWYEMPESYKKSIIICMARSQVPLELTAGGFYVFTLQNFTGVVRSAAAYVSMLRTML